MREIKGVEQHGCRLAEARGRDALKIGAKLNSSSRGTNSSDNPFDTSHVTIGTFRIAEAAERRRRREKRLSNANESQRREWLATYHNEDDDCIPDLMDADPYDEQHDYSGLDLVNNTAYNSGLDVSLGKGSRRGAKVARRTSTETMQDFLAKKRQIFMLQESWTKWQALKTDARQMSIDVKEEETDRLQAEVEEREEALEESKAVLERDLKKFETFLKTTDRNAVNAMRRADELARKSKAKAQEKKRLQAKINTVLSSIRKLCDDEARLLEYKAFLRDLAKTREVLDQHGSHSTKETAEQGQGKGGLAGQGSIDQNGSDSASAEKVGELVSLFRELEDDNLRLLAETAALRRHTAERETLLDSIVQKKRITVREIESRLESFTETSACNESTCDEANGEGSPPPKPCGGSTRGGKTHTQHASTGLKGGTRRRGGSRALISDAYAKLANHVPGLATNKPDLSTMEMLRQIERGVVQLRIAKDKLPQDIVARHEKRIIKERRQIDMQKVRETEASVVGRSSSRTRDQRRRRGGI